MTEILIGFLILFSLCSFILLIILWRRKPGDEFMRLQDKITSLDDKHKTFEDTVKNEIARNRQETAVRARGAGATLR